MESVGLSAVQWEVVPRVGEGQQERPLHLQEQLISSAVALGSCDGMERLRGRGRSKHFKTNVSILK